MYRNFYPTSWFVGNPSGKAPIFLPLVPLEHMPALVATPNLYQYSFLTTPQLTVDGLRRLPFGMMMEPVNTRPFPGRRNLGGRQQSRESLGEPAPTVDSGISSSRSSTPSSVDDGLSTTQPSRPQRKKFPMESQGQHSHRQHQSNSRNMSSTLKSRNSRFDMKKIPHNPKDEWQHVSLGMWNHFLKARQREEMYTKKQNLRNAVHSVLINIFPGCGLRVVGSSENYLGTNSSDVDMCLIFPRMEIDQQTQAMTILLYAQRLLTQCSFVKSTDLITAKVPILKFIEKNDNIQVDLNVNNTVGIANTQLLRAYARLDWRIPPLVLVIKKWAQDCKINNAKEMTLSSYSLVLMIVHYLQCGCDPPVLPCLQKINRLYEDYRTWIPPSDETNHQSKNLQSLGSLLFGFFDYYTEKFNFSDDVISVRLGCKLPKEVAMNFKSTKNKRGHWKFICIEEPFNRTNTACAVYDQVSFNRILSAFKCTWTHLKDKKDLNSVISS